ncbi:MAG TPA: hypothetical protein VFQ88_07880 [Nevskiaceae bacterium]|nr:hypothetical protein [Nevskiaceae bacterium]
MSEVIATYQRPDAAALRASVAARLAVLDRPALQHEFLAQHEFLYQPGFLPPQLTQALVAAMQAARPALNRNFIPGHKKGGSVSRHSIDELAPWIAALYAVPEFVDWLQALCGQKLWPCPSDDPHAYALYFYTEAGDHIGWHYDTSYYRGSRYTVLIGVVDHSSCKLGYRLHTKDPGHVVEEGEIALMPGDLVFFNGDHLQHRITPSRAGEDRVSLTLEYVTDPRMSRGWRFVSNMKDAIGYFGFRETFRRRS